MASREVVDATVSTIAAPSTAAAPARAPHSDAALHRVGKFVLLDLLGSGGMGVVYEALDQDLARKVAIKLVATHARSDRAQARLLREAQAQARVSHPNVVAVYEVGSLNEDQLFIAMELVEGPTLRAWQDAGPRRWQDIVATYAAAGAGLAAAHRHGLVHRDFKPDNVLIGDDGRPRVADFGLAFAVETARATPATEPHDGGPTLPRVDAAGSQNLAAQPAPATASGGPGATRSSSGSSDGDTPPARDPELMRPPLASADPLVPRGPITGTPGYIAPEQLAGGSVDARADQFAFCVALYEALHGVRPPTGRRASAGGRPARRRTTEAYPRWLWDVVIRGLSRDPGRRFASMDALLAELTRRRDGSRRRTAIAVAATAVVVTAGVALAVQPAAPAICPRGDAKLAGIWDPPTKQRLRAAVAGPTATLAGPAWTSTEAALDRYAERWLDAQQAACRATHVDHVQSAQLLDLRVDCLEDRRRSLAAAAEVLRDRPAQALAHAGDLIASVPDLAPCADGRALIDRGPHRATNAPGDPPKLAALRTQVSKARALVTTEDLDGAEASLAAAAELSRALGASPAQAEVDDLTARIAMLRGDLAGAIAGFERAAGRAITDHDDELAAEIYLRLARVAAARELRPAEGKRWLSQAEAWLHRLGHPRDERRFLLEEARGDLQLAAGDAGAALTTATRALDDAARSWSAADPRLIPLLDARAIARARLGQGPAAAQDAERAVALGVAAWGPSNADVARARRVLGLIYLEQLGDVARGEAALTSARQVFAAQQGPDAFEVAGCEQGLSEIAQYRGDLAAVLAHAAHAEQIFARWLGASHPRRAEALNGVAVARFLLRDYAGAVADYEAVYPIWREALGAEHPSVGLLLSNTGEALLALERLDAAQADFERALAILRKALPADSTDLAYPLKGLGLTLLQRGRTRDAIAPLEQALALRVRAGAAADPTEVAEIDWGLARALHAQHRAPARARKLANDALIAYQALGVQLGWRAREISQALGDW